MRTGSGESKDHPSNIEDTYCWVCRKALQECDMLGDQLVMKDHECQESHGGTLCFQRYYSNAFQGMTGQNGLKIGRETQI
jgi:hypothetical protein